jgi:hypothetical protein
MTTNFKPVAVEGPQSCQAQGSEQILHWCQSGCAILGSVKIGVFRGLTAGSRNNEFSYVLEDAFLKL